VAYPIVVIPNHLPHLNFLDEWDELKATELIIVQDIGDKPEIPKGFKSSNITIYDHKDIKKDLGKNDWIVPTQSSACRSYGYYKAWQAGATHIYTLDNDCYPDGSNFLRGHIENLESKTTLGWYPSNNQFEFSRGFPYEIREKSSVGISHGLWSNVPDLDAATSLHNPNLRFVGTHRVETVTIPKNNFYPMCGMNLAWLAELTPIMYFGIFGPDWGFDQYDDIWAGVLSKKVCDHLGYAVRSGYPSVEHRKQSNVYTNLKKQAPGLEMNENFWKVVRDIQLNSTGIVESYRELIEKLPDVIQGEPSGYTKKFKEAALIWCNLFE
jgi:hypothetical protein